MIYIFYVFMNMRISKRKIVRRSKKIQMKYELKENIGPYVKAILLACGTSSIIYFPARFYFYLDDFDVRALFCYKFRYCVSRFFSYSFDSLNLFKLSRLNCIFQWIALFQWALKSAGGSLFDKAATL